MKKLVVLIVIATILCSCSKEADEILEFDENEYPQKWQLVKTIGQFVGSERTGADMQWQEYYLLKSDSTFFRWRESDGLVFEERGIFSINENQFEDRMMTLIYNNPNDLVGSCYGSKTEEILWIKSSNKMQNTWNACDGPGLEYDRIE